MTDPRIAEIEAQLADWPDAVYPARKAGLRYLLSLVAEKDQRIKALEAAVRRTAIVYDEAEPGQYRCRHCGATMGHGEGKRVPHKHDCLVLSLIPAPETVETP